jgi:hypothetical protein
MDKLEIIPLKSNMKPGDTSPDLDKDNKLTVQFNPETLSIAKMNEWSFRNDLGDDVPKVIFSGGLAGSLSMKLLFDTTKEGNDVRERYEKLIKMSMVKPSGNRDGGGTPQQVLLQWGKFMSFIAIIQSVTQEFAFFKEDGTPLRAEVNVQFRQAWNEKKKGGTNPTSRTEARRTWIVEQGQRLDWIAYQLFGTTSAWRHIADTNGLEDPSLLRPGQILKIIPLR